MKTAALTITILAIPVALAVPIDYTPEGGWESIDWTKIDYPDGTGENLPSYPAPPGGWESVDYPDGTGAQPPADCSDNGNGPFKFTSTYHLIATPDQVVNGTTPTGGLPGAEGTYAFGINSDTNLICYNIELRNFKGDYQSPALTATHIHEALRGESGSPRIAFPNPEPSADDATVRRSVGCMYGPFVTGVNGTDGQDSGTGFELKRIEEAPERFFADVHSSLAVPGAVRGQLA